MAIPVILKGETPKPIPLALKEGYDYSGCCLHVEFCGLQDTFIYLEAGGRVDLRYTAEQTAVLPLGTSKVMLSLENANGEVRFMPWAKIKVTDSPADLYDGVITIDPATLNVDDLTAADSLGTVKDRLQAVISFLRALKVLALAALPFVACADVAPLYTTPNDMPGDAPLMTNVVEYVEAHTPVVDFSTNNTELVETIEAKAPTPDLSPFLRSDKSDNEVQIFGGLLSGFGFHADAGHNDNGWNQYTAHNGTSLTQSLPSYISSNPWDFQKRGEAIAKTGGVYSVTRYLHISPRLSVGTFNASIPPFDMSGGGTGNAFVFGDNLQTKAPDTVTLGVGTLNTNNYSFVWSGDANRYYMPTVPSMSNPYATRYNGGFHVNPSVRSGMVNPLQNFWIGDTNLNDWISALAPTPTWDTLSGKPTFATVATSGAYSDLSGKPTIPTTAADVGAVSTNGATMTGALVMEAPIVIRGSGLRGVQFGNTVLYVLDENGLPSRILTYSQIAQTSDIPTSMAWSAITNKPSWIGDSKPSYTASEVGALGNSGEQTIAGTGSQEITFTFGSAAPRFTLVDSYGNITHVEADDSSVLRSPIWLKLPATGGTVALTSDIPASMAWGAITSKPTTLSGYGITDALSTNDLSSAISATNTAFSNAVLSVGLNIDTNTVAQINALVEQGEEMPVGSAATVGGLLLALAAAVAALKRDKANKVANATAGNLAALDVSGNLADAGYHFEVRGDIPCIVQYT